MFLICCKLVNKAIDYKVPKSLQISKLQENRNFLFSKLPNPLQQTSESFAYTTIKTSESFAADFRNRCMFLFYNIDFQLFAESYIH